ncbi:MAG: GTP-binding protein, partial [Planctomycetota bacterium]
MLQALTQLRPTAAQAAAPTTEPAVGLVAETEQKDLLRFVTCGSVDDGKSTLIGRLLYESKGIYDDQLAAVEQASKTVGTTGGDLDLALVTDGLKAEREQGITIDVAYRYFSTPRRKFIVADAPGHEQYTRNMVTGASTAGLAILLVDATQGILVQTRRHAFLASLLGIRHVVLAVNKMDLVGYAADRFRGIVNDFAAFAEPLGLDHFTAIPMSALAGENVTEPSRAMDWYDGPTLLEHFERVDVAHTRTSNARLPVQYVSRPDRTFRGYMGTLAGGTLQVGDPVVVLPSGTRTRIRRVLGP